MDPDDKSTSTSVSAPADFDLGAINEAVAESAAHPTPVEDSPALANKALTMDEIADDSKFNDTGVDDDGDAISNVAVHPTAAASVAPSAGVDPTAEKAHEPEAAFISGDIVDAKAEDEDEEDSEPATPNPYENIGRDPLAEDATTAAVPAAAATAADAATEKPAEDSKPLEPVSLDNAITTGPVKKSNKGLIIGIVAGVVVIGIVVALIFILGKK